MLDLKKYLEKVRAVHGNTYCLDWSMVIKNSPYVTAMCKTHGQFYKRRQHFLSGSGCPTCSNVLRYTWKNFLERAKKKHGDFYSYQNPNVRKFNSSTTVEISCPAHGTFTQKAGNHLKYGCPSCGNEKIKNSKRKTKEGFLNSAFEKYGNLYDYSKVEYVDKRTKIKIGCRVHGYFMQTPTSHLRNGGCPLCTKCNSLPCWLSRFKEVHEELYDYSKFSYKNMKNKSEIVCPRHGSFFLSAFSHYYDKTGCPECSEEKRKNGEYWKRNSAYGLAGFYGSNNNKSNLYLLKIDSEFLKIGLSKDVNRRILEIQRNSGYRDIEVVFIVKDSPARKLFQREQDILMDSELMKHFPEKKFAGRSECFDLSEEHNIIRLMKDPL